MFSNNKTARAVKVRTGTADYYLNARKEIILSAGAFQSRQLLMVSGIGPAETLAKYNITTTADRPGVGQNMWDHTDITVSWKVDVVTFSTLSSNSTFAQEQVELFNNPPSASVLGTYRTDCLGWEKLPEPYRSNLSSTARADLATFADDWPEIEYETSCNGQSAIIVVAVSPLSRGNVTIQSPSMQDPPHINPNWLSSPTGLEVVLQSLKRARTILSSSVLAPILIGNETLPGTGVQSDEQLIEYIRDNVFMNWHAAATCTKGRKNDSMAVVDSKARVMVVEGLWIRLRLRLRCCRRGIRWLMFMGWRRRLVLMLLRRGDVEK
jgi:choline dehydrogenase